MGSLAALIDQLEPEVEDPEEGETHAVILEGFSH
jgi:hypothetical protein